MSDANPAEEATLFPKTAGERLREAREAQGLSLAEIAARTRIPLRQLEAIELSNYALLPSITYSVGFAKAYARAVGADEVEIAKEVRNQSVQSTRRVEFEAYEMPDPSRTPTNGLALAGLAVAVLLLIGVGLWYGTTWFRGEDGSAATPVAAETTVPEPQPTVAPVPAGAGQVTLVATDEVWMRIYDATGKTLFQDTLQPGARYDVPGDANGPMINVGRPDKLQVTLNGSNIAPLGDGRVAIKDVGISAAALTARSGGAPVVDGSATGASVTPAPGAPASAPAPRAERRTVRPSQRTSPRSSQTNTPTLPVATLPAAPVPATGATPGATVAP